MTGYECQLLVICIQYIFVDVGNALPWCATSSCALTCCCTTRAGIHAVCSHWSGLLFMSWH